MRNTNAHGIDLGHVRYELHKTGWVRIDASNGNRTAVDVHDVVKAAPNRKTWIHRTHSNWQGSSSGS